jgi:branched-chain amino acid aminotransferase
MTKELLIYLDGKLVPESQARVSVFDHGLLYGDGVFEGIRFYNGRVFRLEEHTRRLYDSAKALLLNVPITPEEMIHATVETVKANGLSPYKCPKPTVFIIAASIQLYPESAYRDGLVMATVATRRPRHDILPPQVKSLNYLNNVMAKVEALQAGAEEGLMLNDQGLVAECTGDNLFIVRDGAVSTPPLSAGALDGITRRVAFEIAGTLGISIHERDLTRHDIFTADECFLTGTAAEVIAAVKLDQRVIGTGKPGAITQRFVERFRELTQTTGTPVYE